MTIGNYRVYLWRYDWDDFTLWKIGCTGMDEMQKRIRAWSGWLGMTSVMTRALTNVSGRWTVERVAISAGIADSTEARRMESGLHRKYAGIALGHELFLPHEDFGPEFFGDDGAADDQHPLFSMRGS